MLSLEVCCLSSRLALLVRRAGPLCVCVCVCVRVCVDYLATSCSTIASVVQIA
jgi:hypothetical protein